MRIEALADWSSDRLHDALRHVATLVARQRPASEVLAAVAETVGRVLEVEDTRIVRYEPDGEATVVASWGKLAADIPVGTRWTATGENITTLVLRTGLPARKDGYDDGSGAIGDQLERAGVRSAVGTPIVVGGRVWGAMIANSVTAEPLPAETEARISRFTELAAMAISNLQTREELSASRRRLAAAGVAERHRVVRDLHDGAQQRLVHTVITLKRAREALEAGDPSGIALVTEAIGHAERATEELRELAHGILPSVLTHGGLIAAVKALAARSSVPVEIHASVDRLPPSVEATAYFVVAEALTNVVKHAHATFAAVSARVEADTLHVEIYDDGIGGARREGHGLTGLADRLAALDGRLRVESRAGGGTLVVAEIPVADPADDPVLHRAS